VIKTIHLSPVDFLPAPLAAVLSSQADFSAQEIKDVTPNDQGGGHNQDRL